MTKKRDYKYLVAELYLVEKLINNYMEENNITDPYDVDINVIQDRLNKILVDRYKSLEQKKIFTEKQLSQICYTIDEWYFNWKSKITDNHQEHRLGVAKEELKRMFCDMTQLDDSEEN